MASKSSTDSDRKASSKHEATVIGRSAITGRFVLKPASKGSSITIKEAIAAARSVAGRKK